MIVTLPNGRGSFLLLFTIGADGKFIVSTSATAALAMATSTGGENALPRARAVTAVEFSGRIVGGRIAGQVEGTGETFFGNAQIAGVTSAFVGFYEAPILNGGSEQIFLIVAADGTAVAAQVDDAGTTVARGSVAANGEFSVRMNASTVLQGSLTGTGTLAGQSMTAGKASGAFLGVTPAVVHTDRLVNLSTRGMAGDEEKIIIAGFVIGGDQPKEVLIRGTGPGLIAHGVDGAMENPVLTLYRGSQAIQTNDDWARAPNAAAVSAAALRIGAFPLTANSTDAAILTTLEPGSYTAQIARVAGSLNGIALIEIFDASAAPGGETQKLINLSSRGEVRNGSGILIADFVVTRNYPKILIRGIGPALAGFGLGSPLANPVLQLYRGTTAIAANDDWQSDQAVALTEASAQVGAFALGNGSWDAAIVITRAPGAYSAQVSGRDQGTGVALLEVYEVP